MSSYCWSALLSCVVVSLVTVESTALTCAGGFSLLGIDSGLTDREFYCCDDRNLCHGYNSTAVADLVSESLQKLLKARIPFKKPKIEEQQQTRSFGSTTLQDPPTVIPQGDETVCCTSNTSLIYPLSAVSATTKKRVAVVQIGPFKQGVIYSHCVASECRILRGNCTQIYLPQPLYILTSVEGELSAKLDFVLVEAGCQCQTSAASDASVVRSAAIGVDPSVKQVLHIVTGIDFEDDYLALLSAISSQVIAAPSDHIPAVHLNSGGSNSIDLADGISDGSPTTLANDGVTSFTPHPSHGFNNKTNQAAAVDNVTRTSTESTSSVTRFVPLWPDLPRDPGSPVLIPPGYFNPVMQAILPFLP